MARVLDEDELIEHWTLIGDELDLLVGRTRPSKLARALWLKFFAVEGRFPSRIAADLGICHEWGARGPSCMLAVWAPVADGQQLRGRR